ncbi:hypothetical protein AZE42_07282 [Rhizopogon vesiculosus]|uniref:Uncharacterized protein n=1 Tax=Rhizopogon vesiculosus TaxID=180088 RepID=A0A1J8QFY3_9AGAM|nr:hypothetical protein AZE42_07282 [Rhizopogon vesiculosus]
MSVVIAWWLFLHGNQRAYEVATASSADASYNKMKIPFAQGCSPSVPVAVEGVTDVEDE